ncbi:hypothetical protein OsI_34646 [Oryza sativa Indica Group]|uniref:Uncharacterized protein n=1 Tax=Oryza sativa subsp. indica TaxID=39946 RepID=A2ZA84_ORYSI|nr:hypothetical protein OsI_34646 [Oryza sativa Indica Group]
MTRRCSHCSHNGHNSRTCPNRGVKIFGVRLTDGSIRKSASMGNLSLLSSAAGSTSGGASPADGPDAAPTADDGYASDDFVQGLLLRHPRPQEGFGRFDGVLLLAVTASCFFQAGQTLEKAFNGQIVLMVFLGLKKNTGGFCLDCKSLAKSMDLPPLPGGQEPETQVLNQPALPPPREEEEVDSMESDTSAVAESSSASAIMPDNLQSTYPVIVPAYFSPFLQFSVPFWQNQKDEDGPVQETHEIVKPVPVHSKSPINVDELVGMSKLSIGESNQETVSTSLSLNLVGGQNRQSAFHANPPTRAQA